MSWKRWTNRAEEPVEMEDLEPELRQALGDFRANVKTWSDAVYRRPRTVREVVVRRSWRLAAGWSLASVLLAGTLSLGLYEHRHAQVQAQLAAQREAEQQRELAVQRARELARQEEDLLASVDREVSREVPSSMEALVQLNEESEVQQ